ncbi:hypothetical protein [Burkholderia sp. 22PA0106]|uniref:hypothetical protein n=1 Tax=Burkholderia sp. 22PA0106 TaxID=3237371 RepID=UPI0039C129DC
MIGKGEAGWARASSGELRKLLAAVDADDTVDTHVALPERLVVACSDDLMRRCFGLCFQFWEEGVARSDLLRLIWKLQHVKEWSEDERTEFKQIRARYKHLRFAQQLYGKCHRRDSVFGWTTVTMGHLQDALRGGDRAATARYASRLRLLLARPSWMMTVYALAHTRLDDASGFLAYRRGRMRRLKETLTQAVFTGDEFHEMRKIVSEQVSYYDTLRSLDRAEDTDFRTSRFLAAINGLMGARHDEMVAESQSGQREYQARMPLDPEIRGRLDMLVARYPL